MMVSAMKKLLVLFCCCALCLGLIPVQAFAPTQAFAEESTTVRSIEMGSDAIWKGDTVYFGETLQCLDMNAAEVNTTTYATWSVLSKTGNGGTYFDNNDTEVQEDAAMLLFPTQVLWDNDTDYAMRVYFTLIGGPENYKESILRSYLNNEISSYFNDIEWNSILKTTKDGYQNYYDEFSGFTFSDEGLNGDRLFALSVAEFRTYITYRLWVAWIHSFFLHSLSEGSHGDTLISIFGDLHIGGDDIKTATPANSAAVRPALNLNMNNILFASNPTDGTSTSAIGLFRTFLTTVE